jgi:hypothetical protein
MGRQVADGQSPQVTMRDKQKPVKSLSPVRTLQEWRQHRVATIDPFTLEQLMTGNSAQANTTNYIVRRLPGGQCTVHLNRPSQRAPFLGSSGSSEEESLGSEMEAMRTLAGMTAEVTTPLPKRRRTPSPTIQVSTVAMSTLSDADDSLARSLRSKDESNRIFGEIASRKRTMHLTGRPGAPLNVTDQPFSLSLEVGEFELCCFLRLAPLQYLNGRETLLRNYRRQGFFRKSAAQKMLRIDVNKTGSIYEFCRTRRWLPQDEFDAMTVEPPLLPSGAEQYMD